MLEAFPAFPWQGTVYSAGPHAPCQQRPVQVHRMPSRARSHDAPDRMRSLGTAGVMAGAVGEVVCGW
jgi:hypothetical protein